MHISHVTTKNQKLMQIDWDSSPGNLLRRKHPTFATAMLGSKIPVLCLQVAEDFPELPRVTRSCDRGPGQEGEASKSLFHTGHSSRVRGAQDGDAVERPKSQVVSA
jgi:hypothetical protein